MTKVYCNLLPDTSLRNMVLKLKVWLPSMFILSNFPSIEESREPEFNAVHSFSLLSSSFSFLAYKPFNAYVFFTQVIKMVFDYYL